MPTTTTHDPRPPTSRRRRVGPLLAGAAAAVALAACGIGPVAASGDVASGEADDADVTITMTDNAFAPDEAVVAPGESITLQVVNDGDAAHNLVIEDLDVSTGTVQPGAAAHATVTVPDGGVDFQCTFHPDMTGRVATS